MLIILIWHVVVYAVCVVCMCPSSQWGRMAKNPLVAELYGSMPMVWCKRTEITGGRQWRPTTGLTRLLSLPCVSSLSSQPCFQLQDRQNKHGTNVVSHSRLKAIILGTMLSHLLICYEFTWIFFCPWLLLQPYMLMIMGRMSNRQQLIGLVKRVFSKWLE